MDDRGHCLQRRRDVDVCGVDVYRYVGAAGEASAWVFGPVVGAAQRDSVGMIHPVEATEDAAKSVLLWLQLLLSCKNLPIQLKLFMLVRIDVLHLKGLLEHHD